jgi:hypothetical protein
MKQLIVGMALAGLMTGSAGAQTQVEHYQMVTVPASRSEAFPEVFLLDTTTGQTWSLLQAVGHSVEWSPVRYWTGQALPAVPLPPSPDTIGPANPR